MNLQSKKNKAEDEAGFTLIEVLVAMVILTAGLLGMAALTAGIVNGNKHGRNLTTATILAQDQMEEARRSGYSGVAASENGYNTISGFPTFRRVTSVAAHPSTADMKTVTVEVFWDSGARSMTLQTILAK